MSAANWVQFAVFIAVLVATAVPIGRYMAKVYGDGEKAPGDRIFAPVERLIYRACRVDPNREQPWTVYAYSLLGFSVFSFLAVYALQRLQGHLPFNPTDVGAVVPHLSFNTAVSFMTNTNWQSYAGEATMSHLTQMVGLGVQNFVSAAAGMAILAALVRGLARRRAKTIGNFWVDLTRSTVRVLLPLAFIMALVLVSQGVIQNFHGFTTAHTVQDATEQLIPGGPAASQVAIKQLGTNGGGFFNMNSAHPFENSTQFNNFVEMWAILVIPFAFAFTFGRLVRDKRQGRAVFAIMFIVWLGMSLMAMGFEGKGNSQLTTAGADQSVTSAQAGGNMEGKEIRFGPSASGLWAASTTGTSNGSVKSMHDSMTPLGGGVVLSHIMLGEVSPGGVGVGLSGLLVMAILSVFIAGLMVGRTPEYLGKKIQAAEMKMVALYVLAMPTAVLGFTAASMYVKSVLHTSIRN
ncbi:MAG TPA: potassium-transporting ATPase subunit KdpA, partial [Ilumatobacteraceae bacterium]|nr:potassium-transporting ATPase subunit KdpA [Ilumatobacteraceae bacterium]